MHKTENHKNTNTVTKILKLGDINDTKIRNKGNVNMCHMIHVSITKEETIYLKLGQFISHEIES